MRIMFQALQAVTVELTGIILVVWLLFGCASWGIRTTTSSEGYGSNDLPTLLHSVEPQLTEMIPQPRAYSSLGLFKRT